MMDLMTEDPAWQLWVDRKHAIELAMYERILEAAKGRIDFMWMGEDLGSSARPAHQPGRVPPHDTSAASEVYRPGEVV